MQGLFTLEHVVDLWIAGFLVTALLVQGVFARGFALSTSWAYTGGWQREIAIFDLTLALLLCGQRFAGKQVDLVLLAPFLIMFVLLGANHLLSALRAPSRPGHWAGVAANCVALGAAGLALVMPALAAQ